MNRLTAFLLAIVASFGGLGSAHADYKTRDGRIIECYCTDTQGARRELGEVICLTVGGRSFMAKCVMAQNVPFWRDQEEGCLSSRAEPPFTPWPDATRDLAQLF